MGRLKNSKHIAFFVPSLNIGGVESVFLTYSAMLSQRGYQVDLVVCKAEGALIEKISKNVKLFHFEGAELRRSAPYLRKYIKENDVSTIITGPDITNFISILVNRSLPKKYRVNMIVTQHNVPDNDAKNLGLIGRFIPIGKRLLYRLASHVIAVSNAVTSDLIRTGVPSHKITTIYNPISLEKIEWAASESLNFELPEKYILFVGRLCEVKNVGLLIRAFIELGDLDLHLIIVGDGVKRAEWEAYALESVVSEKIYFTGALSNPLPIIKRAQVVAVPSFSEAFPMVVVEAAALGCTIAYTPNLGCLEILGTDYGYCSEGFEDAVDFARTLRNALSTPINPDKMKSLVKKIDESEIIPKIELLICQ